MSSKTRSKHYEPMSHEKLNSFITPKPEPIFVERTPVQARPVLFSEEAYDTLHPEKTIKEFCAAIRDMLARYEDDKARLTRLESEMQDILHFMEMARNKNAMQGFKLYQKLSVVRRERRAVKNEIDLLQPVYELFHGTKVLDGLAQVQGLCHTAKQSIDSRGYAIRTDVLDDFIRSKDNG